MAVLTPRLVLVCALPAVLTLLTLFWTRQKRKTLTARKKKSTENLTSTQHQSPDLFVHSRTSGALPADQTDFCESLANDLKANRIAAVNNFHEEVLECIESRKVVEVQVQSQTDCCEDSANQLIDNRIAAVDNYFHTILSNKATLQRAESELAVEEVQQSFIFDSESTVQRSDCLKVDASTLSSSSDNQVNKTSKVLENHCSLSVEDIEVVQDIFPEMHVKSDEKQLSAKLDQDCHLSPQSGSTSDLSDRQNSPVNSEASYSDVQDDTKPRRNRGSCRFSEESRDSAMGEDLTLLDEPECTDLESATLLCENRTECEQQKLILQKLQQPVNGESSCFNDLDALESPPPSIYSDGHSEGSCDSGKGGSDIQVISNGELTQLSENAVLVYEFELAQELCGRLIGKHGKHVNFIKSSSNANVFIKRHPFNARLKLCALQGTKSEIKNSLELIRKRFPLSQYPALSLAQVNIPLSCGVMVPETLQLHLPEGVTCDVILSSMVSAGHFFVQQPTHPTYPSLNRLDSCMTSCYSQMDTPQLPQPVEVGVICACPVLEGWFRAQVVNLYENSEECDVKFVDYGGYSCVPMTRLRQIRSDFMTLPFQASECYLANVKPLAEAWSLEACATFEELAQGQILQSLVVGHAEDGTPYVHLYRVQGVSTVFINRELVNRGVAQWLEAEM